MYRIYIYIELDPTDGAEREIYICIDIYHHPLPEVCMTITTPQD